jgi:molecular chaperone HscB
LGDAQDFLARQVCGHCGQPQPVVSGEDYFTVFGVVPRFAQNRGELEKRYYALSRALHPDRFSTSAPDVRARSLERMSLVNDAYQTLKDPARLRGYILSQKGVETAGKPNEKAQLPVELAESWFELQDSLVEDPQAAREKLSQFENELKTLKQRTEAELQALEQKLDCLNLSSSEVPLYRELARKIQSQSYLNSMERDVERIRARVGNGL